MEAKTLTLGDTVMQIERELMRGAGPVAVMSLLSKGEMYGYQLVETLTKQTEGMLEMGQSTLYPLLYNLEAKGLVSSERRVAANGRTRKYYTLTGQGETRLAADRTQWQAVTDAMYSLGVVSGRLMMPGLAVA
ncbi:MAG: PadR family transcriptional regulator [Planctomycetota bacterium]|nr:PadR family transcriptional regulator [Planctomycetota bacterium]